MDESLKQLVHDKAAEGELAKAARKSTPGIRTDGFSKVLQGVTSIDEVLRVSTEF